MSTLFFRKPRLTALTVCLIAVSGITAYVMLPRLEDPVLNNRYGVIKTPFAGATPARVESLVTEPIEDGLSEIEEIKFTESSSNAEMSIIRVELRDEITEVDTVWSRVRDKLKEVRGALPDEAASPRLEELDARAFALIVGISWDGPGQPNRALLRRHARQIRDVLRAVKGTEKVQLFGMPEERIIVEIDPARAAAIGLSISEVAAQLRKADPKLPSGQFRSQKSGLLFDVANGVKTLQQIRNTPIAHGSGSQSVVLSEIATVRKAFVDPPEAETILDGQTGVALGVLVRPDRRIDLWARDARSALQTASSDLPPGLSLNTVFDQSRYTQGRLNELMWNLCLGATAVVCVVLLLMGWRSAVLVGITLPLSALFVFAGMQVLGIAVHQMSVMGIIIALGLLIDNAIVMVDEITRELRDGHTAVEAIRRSVKKLFVPLLGSTLTTTIAFMPIALMIGPSGEFVLPIAVSVILAVIGSLFLAMTVVPALTGFLQREPGDDSRSSNRPGFWKRLSAGGFSHAGLTRRYSAALTWMFRQPLVGVCIGLALPLIGFACAASLKEQFFPPAVRDQVTIEIELPAHASLSGTRESVRRATDILKQERRVTETHWFLGRSAPTFFYNMGGMRERDARYAQALVQLDSVDEVAPLVNKLQRRLNHALPGARVLVRQLGQGPPIPAPIEMRVYHEDLQVLQQQGETARRVLSQTPHVVGIRAELNESMPKIGVHVHEHEAKLAGLSKAATARQLDAALRGVPAGSILEETERIPIVVRLPERLRGRLDRLRTLELHGGGAVPLDAVAELRLSGELSTISHRNGRRVNIVRGFVAAGVLSAEVLADYRRRMQPVFDQMPTGCSVEFGGEESHRDEAVANLLSSVGVLSVMLVATLVLSLGSFRMAGVIGLVGALSIGLGVLALTVWGSPFGFMAIIGTMGLVGVAINDSIVVLTALREGDSSDPETVARIVVAETRHVLATTLTTIAGFLPLLVDGGEFWPPLAIAIAGGVTGATILALSLVPATYILLTREQPAVDPVKAGTLRPAVR